MRRGIGRVAMQDSKAKRAMAPRDGRMSACDSSNGMKPTFFPTPLSFGQWLERHHAEAEVLWVGIYKKGSGKPSMTWPESVDQALCYGWIDGLRKRVDQVGYMIRFTPRKPGSTWSGINIRRAEALIAEGQMRPAGLKAYKTRNEKKSGVYSYEQRSVDLEEPYNGLLKRNRAAWSFMQSQPGSYRKTVNWWILSAKKEETRLKRLEQLFRVRHARTGIVKPHHYQIPLHSRHDPHLFTRTVLESAQAVPREIDKRLQQRMMIGLHQRKPGTHFPHRHYPRFL